VIAVVLGPLWLLAPCGTGFAGGFDSIRAGELQDDLELLASPELEGRDTPSLGLRRAARRIAERFERAGLLCAPDSAQAWREITGQELEPAAAGATAVSGTYLRPWSRTLPAPDPATCALVLAPGEKEQRFQLGVDFVPVAGQEGDARAELVFAGFGIESKSEHYSDLDGLKLRGKIALIVAGEPQHPRAFEGPEVTSAAALWRKLDDLAQAGAAAVLVVRRPPATPVHKKEGSPALPAEASLAFRYTWADWVGAPRDAPARAHLPVAEISPACASALSGEDVLALAQRGDKSAKPVRLQLGARLVQLAVHTQSQPVPIDNVVGWVRGSDLADEFVVVGAHYDHVGVDDRGRIGCGADDNASGTAALLEIAEAVAGAGPRRSVYFCAFSGEEDGLLGSQGFCTSCPCRRPRSRPWSTWT
jgi:hypothetical protein